MSIRFCLRTLLLIANVASIDNNGKVEGRKVMTREDQSNLHNTSLHIFLFTNTYTLQQKEKDDVMWTIVDIFPLTTALFLFHQNLIELALIDF